MKILLTWLGVLVGSVVLGAGLYAVVVAPATSGLDVSGRTAAPDPARPVKIDVSPRSGSQPQAPSQQPAAAAPVTADMERLESDSDGDWEYSESESDQRVSESSGDSDPADSDRDNPDESESDDHESDDD